MIDPPNLISNTMMKIISTEISEKIFSSSGIPESTTSNRMTYLGDLTSSTVDVIEPSKLTSTERGLEVEPTGVVITETTHTVVRTASSEPAATASGPGSISTQAPNAKETLTSDRELSFIQDPANYFLGVYFPVLLAVIFRMLIGYLYENMKMMEPFFMLSQPGGVPAKDFIWINYLSANDSLAPYWALISGHWLMLWTSVLYFAVQLLSTFAAELISVRPSRYIVGNQVIMGSGGFAL